MAKKFEYFGKYILLEKLNVGGMAEVFLARASSVSGIAKFVAIKRILPQYAENPEFIDMFKDEAKIAINLNHSNIVSIHEFGIERKQFFLVMDYVEGRNLRQILNKMKASSAQFSIDQIVYIIKEVAAGLDHAHRCLDGTTGKPLNITHRDMSPQNVMVSFEGEVKIVDFGIAKAESQIETTRAGTLKGKFGYMSPEQAEGQTVDLRTDIFSLGTVLWELLANDRLFIANNEINTLRKIRDCQIPSLRKINPNIHAELERIVQKALARDRNLRYQTAAALHRDLNRFLNRQYPDFSPHDFSVFTKTLFADEILSTRKRLIDYSKIPFQPEASRSSAAEDIDDKTTLAENTITSSYVSATNTPESLSTQQAHTFSESEIDFSDGESGPHEDQDHTTAGLDVQSISNVEGPEEQTQTQTNPDRTLTQSNDAIRTKKDMHVLDEHSLQGEMARNIPVTPASPYALETEEPSLSHKPQKRRHRKGSHYERGTRSGNSPALSFFIVTLVAFAGFSYAVKYYTKNMMPIINATKPIASAYYEALGVDGSQTISSDSPEQKGRSQQAPRSGEGLSESLPQVDASARPNRVNEPSYQGPLTNEEASSPTQTVPSSIMVSSAPSGAEIYIDERNTGLITPSMVDVPPPPFTVSLKRTGYIEYNKTVSGMDGSKVNATLQKALIGYLDIDVRPPKDVRIYINGKWLKGETLPITRYAVPAQTELTIRAENPYTKTSAQRTVTVPQDRRKRVIFELNRRGRTPSQSR